MRQADAYYELQKHEVTVLDDEKSREDLTFYVYPDLSDDLIVSVENHGAMNIEVVRIWLNNDPQPETTSEVIDENPQSNTDSGLAFTVNSVNEDLIVNQIVSVTGLSLEQARSLVNFVYNDPVNYEDETIVNSNVQIADLGFIEKIGQSVIIRVG